MSRVLFAIVVTASLISVGIFIMFTVYAKMINDKYKEMREILDCALEKINDLLIENDKITETLDHNNRKYEFQFNDIWHRIARADELLDPDEINESVHQYFNMLDSKKDETENESDQTTNQAISVINSLFTISKKRGYFCVLNRGKRGDLVTGFISHLWPNQVIYYKDGTRIGDAVCQYGSYGYQQGLFEIMGDALLTTEERENDSVLGYLRLEEVLDRLERVYEKKNERDA